MGGGRKGSERVTVIKIKILIMIIKYKLDRLFVKMFMKIKRGGKKKVIYVLIECYFGPLRVDVKVETINKRSFSIN